MNNPFHARAPAFNANAINDTIEKAFAAAGLDTRNGPMRDLTESIRSALSPGHPAQSRQGFGADPVIDVEARVVPTDDDGRAIPQHLPPVDDSQRGPGRFETRTFSNEVGTRAYKLYVPAMTTDAPRAMVVMLHGCTQTADDFAAGTQMNRLADAHGFLVVYPEQSPQANASKCWNWFRPQDQVRDAGEPSIIAGIVREVALAHGADARRIFVAGLSAGAAMAVILGETYPELFAAVGAHSGLPYGSAHDVPSALSAMKGGRGGSRGSIRRPGGGRHALQQPVPIIVFHGDRDHTVQQSNGDSIVRHALEAHARVSGGDMRVTTQTGVASGGRRFSRTVHTDAAGHIRIENWTLQGGGHAWSGGDAASSYTDRTGPDASAEMVRFFLALPGAGSA